MYIKKKTILLIGLSIIAGWFLDKILTKILLLKITIEPTLDTSQKEELTTDIQFAGYSEKIALGIEETSPKYAAYWRKYVKFGITDPEVNDKTLEKWANEVCTRYESSVTSEIVYEWFYPLYVDFILYSNKTYMGERNIQNPLMVPSEAWEIKDLTIVFELAVQEAIEIKCPNKILIDKK